MAARAIWKGVLRVGSLKLPVKVYSAAQERGVHFRLLASRRHEPVEQHMVDRNTGKVVDSGAIQRGYELEDGYVLLKKRELEKLEPKASRDVVVRSFVSPLKLPPEWLVRPYYLAPDGDEADYFALVEALRASGKEGVAHWVMRGTEYNAVLCAEEGYLALITLRHSEEVVSAADLPAPAGRAHSDKERKMAEQLVAAFSGEFDPQQYHDQYRARVLELVEAKAKGKSLRLHAPAEKATRGSLEAALGKSLKAAKKVRSAQKERHVA